jgi:hypothetical protein
MIGGDTFFAISRTMDSGAAKLSTAADRPPFWLSRLPRSVRSSEEAAVGRQIPGLPAAVRRDASARPADGGSASRTPSGRGRSTGRRRADHHERGDHHGQYRWRFRPAAKLRRDGRPRRVRIRCLAEQVRAGHCASLAEMALAHGCFLRAACARSASLPAPAKGSQALITLEGVVPRTGSWCACRAQCPGLARASDPSQDLLDTFAAKDCEIISSSSASSRAASALGRRDRQAFQPSARCSAANSLGLEVEQGLMRGAERHDVADLRADAEYL